MNPSQTAGNTPMTTNSYSSPNIFATIRQEVYDFLNNYIVIVPGYSFQHYLTLKRINLYLNSKFEEQDDQGLYRNREKLFFNVVVPACEVATKMLNVDSKDIRLLPQNPKSYFSTYLLEKELKQWLKTSKIANVLNQIAEQAPRFGSVVIEKTKNGAKVVDLRKLMLDPTVDSIKDSRFVTTVSYMSPTELRATGWDNVEIAIDRFGTTYGQAAYEDRSGGVNLLRSTPYIKIYTRYGEVPEDWIEGNGSQKMVKSLYIIAGAEEQQKDTTGKYSDYGVILFKSRWNKDWPFKDYHYNKIVGRWLGLGIVESLFDTQVRMNELKNQKRISMEISSLHLFQGPQSMIQNVLTDLQSGDYLLKKGPDGITPIATEERNLPAFKDEEESYFQHAQRLSFAYDAVSGEASAASTTATATINSQQQATSVFGFKRENFTNMLRDFFNDLVLPELMKDLTPEHIMRFTGSAQELQKLDDAAAELYANDAILQNILDGKPMYAVDFQAAKDKALKQYKKLGDNRFLKIKNAFYQDAQFEFDFNTGNEQVNPQMVAQNSQAVLTAIGQNPTITQDPLAKMFLFKYAEALGTSRGEIEMALAEANEQKEKLAQSQPMQIPPQIPVMGSNQLPVNQQTQ